MDNLTISIFRNQTFLAILKEIKMLSKFKFINFDDLGPCLENTKKSNGLIVLFDNENKNFEKIKESNLPLLVLGKSKKFKLSFSSPFIGQINMPFKILDFEKKVISLISKYKFHQRSLINLGSYVIDKNERKIKKGNLELQLTEKEINFLILFTQNEAPLSKNFFLKKVWNYSTDTDTHTIETHIHRLRKKVLKKFNDNNFIKNNEKGYYI